MNSDIYTDGTYLKNNPSWDSEQSAWKASQIAKICQANELQPANCVEVGCGAGQILAHLKSSWPSCNFVGFDPSKDAIQMAKAQQVIGVEYHVGAPPMNHHADLVICADVFEHVEDYIGFLRSIKNISHSFVFHIPLDMNLPSVLLPSLLMKTRQRVGHLHNFNYESAIATLEHCGYQIVDQRITAGCLAFPNPGAFGKLLKFFRSIFFRISPVAASRFLGGFSLMVIAQPIQRS
jgi:SAM-dependent methyltransferase